MSLLPSSYVFEEVNTVRMTIVDLVMEGASELHGTPPWNKLCLHLYDCASSACPHAQTGMMALHVGEPPWLIPCADQLCRHAASVRLGDDEKPLKVSLGKSLHYPIHGFLYRPIGPFEIEKWAESVEESASRLLVTLERDQFDPEEPLRLSYKDAEASRILNGHLVAVSPTFNHLYA